jgi:hypothetical protein
LKKSFFCHCERCAAILPLVKNPEAETAGRPLSACVFFGVIPASEARRESFRKLRKIPDKPE